MKKISRILLTLTLLIGMLSTSMAFAGSWYKETFNFGTVSSGYTQEFYNTGSPGITTWFNNAGSSKTYTIKLQYKELNGTWTTIDTQTGTLSAYTKSSKYFYTKHFI